MKFKLFALSALMAIAGLVQAENSISVAYGAKKVSPADTQNHQYVLGAKFDVAKNLALDFNFNDDSTDVGNVITTRTEAGLTYSYPVAVYSLPISTSARIASGEKEKSGSNATSYWSIEPGVNVNMPYNLYGRLAYRYRAAFDDSVADTQKTIRYAVGYNFNKENVIELNYDKTSGDGANELVAVKYIRKF